MPRMLATILSVHWLATMLLVELVRSLVSPHYVPSKNMFQVYEPSSGN